MSNQSRVIALGFFDGVHLGHGALLRRTAEEAKARGVRSAVFTWAQPPKEVVTGVPVPLINSPEDRAWLAKSLYDIDDVIMVPFNKEMMTTSWEDFITEILIKRYHAVHLVAGHDHRFGLPFFNKHVNSGRKLSFYRDFTDTQIPYQSFPHSRYGQLYDIYIRRNSGYTQHVLIRHGAVSFNDYGAEGNG